MTFESVYNRLMNQRRVSKRVVARTQREDAAVGVTFVASAVPLVAVGTLIFPGVGTIVGLLCATAIATHRANRYRHHPQA